MDAPQSRLDATRKNTKCIASQVESVVPAYGFCCVRISQIRIPKLEIWKDKRILLVHSLFFSITPVYVCVLLTKDELTNP